MTTVFGAPTRPATTSLGSATTQRRLLAATFGVVATLLSLSCSDDAPNESTNSLFPDAAADAEATITNPGTTDAGAEELVTSSHQNDTNTSEITTIGEHTGTGALETADGTEDSAQVACTPVACTCPDPTSPDAAPKLFLIGGQ